MSLTVIIPVKDEALHIQRCLESVVGLADLIYVIDSGSTDETPSIVHRFSTSHPHVVLTHHDYEGPAHQKNWALRALRIESEWVLFLDADESVSPALAGAITDATRASADGATAPAVNGWFVNRRVLFHGRFIRHGGWYPNWNLRLIRYGFGCYEDRRVHEHMRVEGKTAFLEGDLIHEDLRDLSFSIAKHNRYSSDEAKEYEQASRDSYGRLFSRDPLARRRWVKTRIWARLPFKAPLYFVWCYLIRLGFLDGKQGFWFHVMHAMYKQFDELKQWERRQNTWSAPLAAKGTLNKKSGDSLEKESPLVVRCTENR